MGGLPNGVAFAIIGNRAKAQTAKKLRNIVARLLKYSCLDDMCLSDFVQ